MIAEFHAILDPGYRCSRTDILESTLYFTTPDHELVLELDTPHGANNPG